MNPQQTSSRASEVHPVFDLMVFKKPFTGSTKILLMELFQVGSKFRVSQPKAVLNLLSEYIN
jgi:hypothetical protein